MNTKIWLEFDTGHYGDHEVSDEVESLIKKGLPFCIKAVHPSAGDVLRVEAGETRETRAEKLVRDLYVQLRIKHSLHQHQPYTWAELHPELMKRIAEFM